MSLHKFFIFILLLPIYSFAQDVKEVVVSVDLMLVGGSKFKTKIDGKEYPVIFDDAVKNKLQEVMKANTQDFFSFKASGYIKEKGYENLAVLDAKSEDAFLVTEIKKEEYFTGFIPPTKPVAPEEQFRLAARSCYQCHYVGDPMKVEASEADVFILAPEVGSKVCVTRTDCTDTCDHSDPSIYIYHYTSSVSCLPDANGNCSKNFESCRDDLDVAPNTSKEDSKKAAEKIFKTEFLQETHPQSGTR